jgi:hypothetical protein
VMPMVQGCCPVRCWKPVVSYHTQIQGSVHGATTHENSTTMSLYGYGLAQYVVEFKSWHTNRLCGEAAMVEPLECSVKLRWLNHVMVWVQLRRLEPISHKRGLLVGAMLTLAVKPQWVCYKLDETIEQPCSDFPSTHLGSV